MDFANMELCKNNYCNKKFRKNLFGNHELYPKDCEIKELAGKPRLRPKDYMCSDQCWNDYINELKAKIRPKPKIKKYKDLDTTLITDEDGNLRSKDLPF